MSVEQAEQKGTAEPFAVGDLVRVVAMPGRACNLYAGTEGWITGCWSMGSQPFDVTPTKFVFRGVEQVRRGGPLCLFPCELVKLEEGEVREKSPIALPARGQSTR